MPVYGNCKKEITVKPNILTSLVILLLDTCDSYFVIYWNNNLNILIKSKIYYWWENLGISIVILLNRNTYILLILSIPTRFKLADRLNFFL